jgi:hypothetical protein
MRKSELIRAALGRIRRLGNRQGERVCYCTPSRNMVRGLETVVLNNISTNDQSSLFSELSHTVADKLREVTNRVGSKESLYDFDREDTYAAQSLNDTLVEEAYEKAALMYEERGD